MAGLVFANVGSNLPAISAYRLGWIKLRRQPQCDEADLRKNEQIDMTWHDIGLESDFALGSTTELVVEDRIVAVCNDEGTLYALDGVCPHQGGPLGKGQLENCVLTCPWHGWQFDVRDGQSLLSPHVKHPTLEIKLHENRVFVQLD